MVLRSKEESAPNHVFNTYWSSYWALSNFNNRIKHKVCRRGWVDMVLRFTIVSKIIRNTCW
jgi:hypothetical protein